MRAADGRTLAVHPAGGVRATPSWPKPLLQRLSDVTKPKGENIIHVASEDFG
jgi:hypothetical protein